MVDEIIICNICKKIKSKPKPHFISMYWHHFGPKWICPKCYNENIRVKKPRLNNEVVCKICNITEKIYYYDNSIPMYEELKDIRVVSSPEEIHTYDY